MTLETLNCQGEAGGDSQPSKGSGAQPRPGVGEGAWFWNREGASVLGKGLQEQAGSSVAFSQPAGCRRREPQGPLAQVAAPLLTFLRAPEHLSYTRGSAPVGWQRQRPQLGTAEDTRTWGTAPPNLTAPEFAQEIRSRVG